ncbi:phospholipase A2, minor isoenzyme-like [Synchiropus picturatus]
MIQCVQPNVSSIMYNRYGCYCGYGGGGTPVDELDQCCQTHDHCYTRSMNLTGCTNITDYPYSATYTYTCSNQTVTCSDSNDKCEAFVCECDRAAAYCFADSPFNRENSHPFWRAHCLNETEEPTAAAETKKLNETDDG